MIFYIPDSFFVDSADIAAVATDRKTTGVVSLKNGGSFTIPAAGAVEIIRQLARNLMLVVEPEKTKPAKQRRAK